MGLILRSCSNRRFRQRRWARLYKYAAGMRTCRRRIVLGEVGPSHVFLGKRQWRRLRGGLVRDIEQMVQVYFLILKNTLPAHHQI